MSPWLRVSAAKRALRAGSLLIGFWPMLALLGWALSGSFGTVMVVVVFSAGALVTGFFAAAIIFRPERAVRRASLWFTTSDEDARKGFPGGGI